MSRVMQERSTRPMWVLFVGWLPRESIITQYRALQRHRLITDYSKLHFAYHASKSEVGNFTPLVGSAFGLVRAVGTDNTTRGELAARLPGSRKFA